MTEEDEAFDEIARKQGMWGGGFMAKRAMAADKVRDETDMLTIAYLDGYERGKKATLAQPAQEPVECLDCGSNNVGFPATYDSLVNSVKAQPAQEPAQEPVAWAIYDKRGGSKSLHWPENHSPDGDATKFDAVPLYTTPPQREWVGLTEKDFSAINQSCLTKLQAATSAESILKDKNNG
jgi:hypothetical protein